MPDSAGVVKSLSAKSDKSSSIAEASLFPSAALALAGGVCFGLANCHAEHGFGMWIAFALLGAALAARPGRAVILTVLFGLPAYGAGLIWLAGFGTLPWVILSAYHILFIVPAGVAARMLMTKAPVAGVLAFGSLFALGEWVRSLGWQGVTMATAAGPLADNPAALQIVPLTGWVGAGFLVVLGGILTGFSIAHRKPGWFVISTAAFVLLLVYSPLPRLELPSRGTLTIAAIQGVTQDGFRDLASDEESLEVYLELSRQAAAMQPRPDVILWPETSAPGYPGNDMRLLRRISGEVREMGVPVVIGAFLLDEQDGTRRLTNSAMAFDGEGIPVGVYQKERLVPFGEFVPWRERLPELGRWQVNDRDYYTGSQTDPLEIAGSRLGVLICSEVMFAPLAASRALDGAEALLVMSNDSWFGTGPAHLQLLRLTVLRSVETGQDVVKAAETGLSLAVDARTGEVTAISRHYTKEIITGTVRLVEGQTPASRWPYATPLALLAVAGLAVFFGLTQQTRQ